MTVLEENWNKIKSRVILPLWNGKFKSMYESAKLDYDDFESLAGFELTKAMGTFNPEKSNIFTYATRVITQKAMTELRDFTRRDKRKALYVAESIDIPVEDDSSKTIADTIPCKNTYSEISELTELRLGSFINSLDNNQLRVLALTLLDLDIQDISQTLSISDRTAQGIVRSLRDVDLTRVLYRRKF